MRSPSHTLTRGAEADLDEIYVRSLEHFGRDQTNRYFGELKKAIEFAAVNHARITTRQNLTGNSGLSLYPVNSLYLVYRPLADTHIVVVAVVSQSRDISTLIMAEEDKFQKEFEDIERKIESGKIRFQIL